MPLYACECVVEFLKTSLPQNNMKSGLVTVAAPDGSRRYEAVVVYLACLGISASYFVNNLSKYVLTMC
jgi:hypothetical protein